MAIPQLERKYHSLYDKVYAMGNLSEAWERVRKNKGAGGVDGESIQLFQRDWERNLAELQRRLLEKRYVPPPVRRHYIPKPDGRMRPLGIPTVRDRIVQQAVKNILEPIFEPQFKDCSYGFRPGRSAHQAAAKLRAYAAEGYRWVVDADIQGFFDNLDHGLLLQFLRERVVDGSVLKLISAWLTAGVMEEGNVRTVVAGTPQGGVISPLLANIYLDQFDRIMEERGYRLIRYADDFVVMCKLERKAERKAERALEVSKEILEGRLKLTLHPEKTRIVHIRDGFDFLGFRFRGRYQGPRAKTLSSFKERVRQITRRQQGKNLQQVVKVLNPVIRGWGGYQRRGNVKSLYGRLDEWIRMRLRAFKEKKKAAYQNRRIPNRWLAKQGLISLTSLLPEAH
ncbi:MAG: group II intron reverse transcriptase/maturase [Symbiobacteriia bacterium]